MTKKIKKLDVASHEGKLYWGSLLNFLPKELIVPATPDREDLYAFGWRYQEFENGLRLAFSNMLYATAEAVVALGVIVDSFRRECPRASIHVDYNASSITTPWVEALRLDQLIHGNWITPARGWGTPASCYAYPLRKIHLHRIEDTSECAADLVKTIKLLPQEVLGTEKDDLLKSVERVAGEVFSNIFHHAYPEGIPCHLYACATVTPAGHYLDSKALEQEFSTLQETQWLFENKDNLILEIALADAGLGIPRTLWEDALRRHRGFASGWKSAAFNAATRAEAHQHLCEYAYHHESSRKREQDFVSKASRLNLRGLHRCQKQTEHLEGCIVVASGQGRAGYAFVGNRMLPISGIRNMHRELPGTMMVLRFSMKSRSNQSVALAFQKGRQPLQIRLGAMVSEDEVRNGLPTEVLHEVARVEEGTKTIATYFPFRKFDSVETLLELLPRLPAHNVGLLAFAHIPDHVLPELRSDSEDWLSATHGLPRLLCVWNADKRCFVWKLAGHIPSGAQKFCLDLERIGQAHLADESAEIQDLARDLAKTYRSFLIWDENGKTLEFAGATGFVAVEDYANLLDKAFYDFFAKANTEDFVYECSKGEAIRLPTGRLVTKFLSVWNLLRKEPVLAAALSHRLFQVLETLGNPSEMYLLADSPASYVVATLLLRNQTNAPRVHIVGQLPKGTLPPQKVVFVDAICRGEAAKRLAKELSDKHEANEVLIVCADMRHLKWPLIPETNWRVESLLKLEFAAPDWDGPGNPTKVLEVDAITHVPFDHVCEFANLATTPEREKFLNDNPDVFCCGFHQVRDLVHSVSLDTAKLVSEHSNKVVSWLADEISSFLKQVPRSERRTKQRKQESPSLVFFCRSDSHVYQLVHRVAEELPRRLPNFKSVLLAHLTSAPRAPKLVFPRSQDNLFGDVRDALRQFELFPVKIPHQFFGVYLDDASITGRTLQDFVSKAATLRTPRPLAILGLLLVNRLSPTEVRFANVCQHLSTNQFSAGTPTGNEPVPFRLASLFRLQVRSMVASEPGSVLETIGKLADNAHYFDEPLKNYLLTIRHKLEAAFGSAFERVGVAAAISHPFYPKDTLPSHKSFRAIHSRHLLALNQQNEGVLSNIIKLINEAVKDDVFDLLGIFALEPYLLRDEPLANECFGRVKELCISCLKSESPPQFKSDALAVIFQNPKAFLMELPLLLSVVISDADLVLQAAAFLLKFLRDDPQHYEVVRKCLDQVNESSNKHVDWLCITLDVPQQCDAHHIVSDEAAATGRIHSLVASTWAHIGLTNWQAFDEGIKTMAYKQDSSECVNATVARECIEYADRQLLFGLGGMHCLAQRRLPPEEALAVWRSLVEGIRARVEMERLLHTPVAEQGDQWKARLVDSWNRLRQSTLKGASPVRFLGMVEEISSKPSAIEQFLPKLYSAPYQLLQKCIRKLNLPLTIEADATFTADSVVIVPVARQVIHEFCRILLENMKKHAELDQPRCKLGVEHQGNTLTLKVEIRNRIRSEKNPGDGMGIPLLKESARRAHFEFTYVENANEYLVVLKFPNVMLVRPQYSKISKA